MQFADGAVARVWAGDGDLLIARDSTVTAAPAGTHWTYTTIIADADELLATVACIESAELRWVAENRVADLPLHPGFEASWPRLRSVLASRTPDCGAERAAGRG